MPEGDPIRAWLHALLQVARDNPIPGPIRINVGITPRGADAIQHSIRRDPVRVEAVDCRGTPTRRIVLEGVMFEWLVPRQTTDRKR